MLNRNFFSKGNWLIFIPSVVLLGVLFYAYQLADAYINVRQIRGLIAAAPTAVLARDWSGTRLILKSLAVNSDELAGDLDRLYPFNALPGLRNEYQAIKKILAAGRLTLNSGQRVIDWLSQLPLPANLGAKDKRVILAAVADSAPLWHDLKKDNDLTLTLLADARRNGWSLLAGPTNALLDKLILAQEIFKQAEPILPQLPRLAGYPAPQTYLLLLQNNTELRPTGGFIGTYGLLTLANGDIAGFQTDNVYNLDEPAKAYNSKTPPEPIRKYLKQSQWFLRDSNWDPDFPASARQALQFYRDERGPAQNFAGVIALTPAIIEDILKIIGPVTVNSHTFTADNLVELLQYKVDVGFKKEGINIYNRKQIIDDVAQVLKTKLLALSPQQLRDFLPIVQTAFAEKQLMVYFTDPASQALAANFNLDNHIRAAAGDYVYVVDANLGSLKTDPTMERRIDYTLAPDSNGQWSATTAITYTNHGQFDWKTTRYRTYTRLYAPAGSELIAVRGNESAITISNEHGKNVFGTFISIEPGTSGTLSFTYKLPAALVQSMARGQYSLLVQKQGGTSSHELNLDITVPFVIDKIAGDDRLKKTEKNQIVGNLKLDSDKEITLHK